MTQAWDKVIEFFSRPPKLFSGFYFTSHCICGVSFSKKHRSIAGYDIQALPKGVILPSLNEKNITEKEILKEEFSKVLEKISLTGGNTALIIPELSQKTFSFTFDNLPVSSIEKEQIIRFRIKKKMPFLPDDARISFDLIPRDKGIRVVALLTRTYIIKQYEEFFRQFDLKVRTVVPPSVGLMSLLGFESDEKFLLVNIELDSFSLSVVKDCELTFYRQKRFDFEGETRFSVQDKTEDIFQEIENTLNFIDEGEEDKEMKLWIRGGVEEFELFFKRAGSQYNFPIKRIGSCLDMGLDVEETEKLSPILGVLL